MKQKISYYCSIFFLIMTPFFSFGQTNTVEFYGVITEINDSSSRVNHLEIIALKGADTLQKVMSQKNGSYALILELEPNEKITLVTHHPFYLSQKFDFTMISNSFRFQFDFELHPLFIDKLNSAIFDTKNSTDFSGFDVELMKFSIRKLDNFCIQFSYFTLTDERDEMVQKRISTFKQFLVENGINADNLVFNLNKVKLNCTSGDCNPRIEGAMISITEKCK